ncbi:MAG: ATP-binding protein [Actinomycetota bacterium]|nr:ATP-binding protein [Actinomycetota bacterium]
MDTPGGQVRVEFAPEGAWGPPRDSNDGAGIAAEDLLHVLERFFRAKGTRVGGSEIRLAVAAGLVNARGGEVALASEPGHGRTFTGPGTIVCSS